MKNVRQKKQSANTAKKNIKTGGRGPVRTFRKREDQTGGKSRETGNQIKLRQTSRGNANQVTDQAKKKLTYEKRTREINVLHD